MSQKPDKAKLAAGRFFMGIGRVHVPREEWSDYLFPLALIMAAQGELADECKHLVTDEPLDSRAKNNPPSTTNKEKSA